MNEKIENTNSVAESSPKASGAAEPFSSNCLRLSPGEWLVVAVIVATIAWLAPVLWQRAEKFEPGPDYRLPYDLSNDYWLYQQYVERVAAKYDTFVIGDSVVWGHYVSNDNTLAAHLNRLAGKEKFANLGVDGTHPAALEGLLRYYGRAIEDKNVILHLNLLWMSSPKHDLQTEKEHHFNHPELVAQFSPKIPCYKASYAERMSAVVKRRVALFNWTSHLNIAYFQNTDVPGWTVDHPYDNPFQAVTFTLPSADKPKQAGGDTRSSKVEAQWVNLETSLQWRSFKRSVELLERRGNRVFVLVGPFNEHKLKAGSIEKYRTVLSDIDGRLRRSNIPYYIPPTLPLESYSDASHPLSEGYAELARQLIDGAALP